MFHQIDLMQFQETLDVIEAHSDAVACIHFASLKAVGESIDEPLWYFRNNLNGMTNMLEAMKISEIQHFIFSSSASVYGNAESLPISESMPANRAISPYGMTKQIGEMLIDAALKEGAFTDAISLRYFNPVGAHNSGLIGELPKGRPNNLMPYITQTAAGVREELVVFGDDYDTRDGSCVRDYLHVVDVARAHLLAVQRLLDGNAKSNH